MGLISKPYTFSAGATIVAAEHNSNFDTIYAEFNGSISNDNISGSAAIASSKLAQITAAGKVNISALTATGQAEGDMFYASSAAAFSRLPKGTAGQLIKMNSGATAPEWFTPSATTATAGTIVQVVNTQTGAVSSGSTAIPDDDTIPQNTEGDEVMTLAITPNHASNKLRIDVLVNAATAPNAYYIAVALFQDSTANALAAVRGNGSSTDNYGGAIQLTHYMAAGTTSETTFKVRIGSLGAGAVTFNGASTARKFGGVMASSITITEIKV